MFKFKNKPYNGSKQKGNEQILISQYLHSFLIILILVLGTGLAGCLEKTPEKYYDVAKPDNYIALYSDGKYVVIQEEPDMSFEGTYFIQENYVFLNVPFGTLKLKIEGKNLTSKNGDVWMKK